MNDASKELTSQLQPGSCEAVATICLPVVEFDFGTADEPVGRLRPDLGVALRDPEDGPATPSSSGQPGPRGNGSGQ
jgi:hypothetical protein